MTFKLWVVFIVGAMCTLVQTRSTTTLDYVNRQLIIGKCRLHCIREFPSEVSRVFNEASGDDEGDSVGQKEIPCGSEDNWKCNMCWDYCSLLIQESDAKLTPAMNRMCSDHICLDGCQSACKHYTETGTNPIKVLTKDVFRQVTNVKMVNSETLSWTKKQKAGNVSMFVVLGVSTEGWFYELGHTTQSRLETDKDLVDKLSEISIFEIKYNEENVVLTTHTFKATTNNNNTVNLFENDQEIDHESLVEILCYILYIVSFFIAALFICLGVWLILKRRNHKTNPAFINNDKLIDCVV